MATRILFFIAFVFASLFASAQVIEVREHSRLFTNKFKAELITDSAKKYKHEFIKDSLGYDMKFSSSVAMINYMERKGWVLIEGLGIDIWLFRRWE